MRANEIISKYIDPQKITLKFRQDLEDALARKGPQGSPELMQAMYGDEKGDLELAQLRADLLKTQAEADESAASAVRDRAEAQRTIGSSARRSGMSMQTHES
ncbi:hypothetical protein [Methylobacterium frigidaeris]|uniref:hypothetical protein n=1 Tax=Methylobacterium frigidaeris TaxID=2038277 RepID=UPI001EDFABA8|nr:hypothetical protein [Methylobacterium frigidaeris]